MKTQETIKTLVVHPLDESTAFLKHAYKGKGYTVLSKNLTHDLVNKEIEKHDRIIGVGHGCPYGLFGESASELQGSPLMTSHRKLNEMLIINSTTAELLMDKDNIFIWCNANQYVDKFKVPTSFHTGMFISEVVEAEMFSVKASQEHIQLSNDVFAKIVSQAMWSLSMRDEIYDKYKVDNSDLINFNRSRFYENRLTTA